MKTLAIITLSVTCAYAQEKSSDLPLPFKLQWGGSSETVVSWGKKSQLELSWVSNPSTPGISKIQLTRTDRKMFPNAEFQRLEFEFVRNQLISVGIIYWVDKEHEKELINKLAKPLDEYYGKAEQVSNGKSQKNTGSLWLWQHKPGQVVTLARVENPNNIYLKLSYTHLALRDQLLNLEE